MSSAQKITQDFEAWLHQQIPIVDADLKTKHQLMADNEFSFFRATYYLWLVRAAEQVPDVLTVSSTPIVGDLHTANFGTWRDESGDIRWGVNDLDELSRGPWLLDLLRLAVSAVISPNIQLKPKDIIDVLLETYTSAEVAPSPRISDNKHLAALVPKFKDTDAFFRKLDAGEVTTDVPPTVREAAESDVEAPWSPTWHAREAGAGSLGHRRVVGVGTTSSGWAAREAKQLGPGTAVWAHARDARLPVTAPDLYGEVVHGLGAPASAVRIDGWQLRALAPEEVRIDLSRLAAGDETRVLRSMATVIAGVHGVDLAALAAAQHEAAALDRDVFHGYMKTMEQTIQQDFENSR